MTAKEITTALESEIHLAEYVDSDHCSNVNLEIIKSALDLINRQKAEYNNLLEQFRILDCECERLEKADENQKVEIERLKAHINEVADKVEDKMTYMSGCQNLIQTVKKIILGDKTPSESLCDNCGLCKEREEEAVNEFAERLKSLGRFTSSDRYYIDKIKKEMAVRRNDNL